MVRLEAGYERLIADLKAGKSAVVDRLWLDNRKIALPKNVLPLKMRQRVKPMTYGTDVALGELISLFSDRYGKEQLLMFICH